MTWTLYPPAFISQVLGSQVRATMLLYAVLWINPRFSCMPGKYSTKWVTPPAGIFCFYLSIYLLDYCLNIYLVWLIHSISNMGLKESRWEWASFGLGKPILNVKSDLYWLLHTRLWITKDEHRSFLALVAYMKIVTLKTSFWGFCRWNPTLLVVMMYKLNSYIYINISK